MASRGKLPDDFDEMEFISAIAEAPQIALRGGDEPRKETKGRRCKKEEYISRFIEPRRMFSPRQGKTISILPEHHTKIQQIVGVVANNRFSIFHYVDNIISDHLTRYNNEITEVFNDKSLIKLRSE